MAILHAVDSWRLKRRFFLCLHYRAGKRYGKFELPDYPRKLLGVPPFLVSRVIRRFLKNCVNGFIRKAWPIAPGDEHCPCMRHCRWLRPAMSQKNEGTSNMREWNPAMLRIDQPMIAERTWRDLHSPSDSGLIQDFGRDGP
jgi:hypothetical protein